MVTQYMDPCNLQSWHEIGKGYCKKKEEKHPIYLSFHKFMDLALPFGGPPSLGAALRSTLDYPIQYTYSDYQEMLQYLAQLDLYWATKAQANPNNKVCCIIFGGTIP